MASQTAFKPSSKLAPAASSSNLKAAASAPAQTAGSGTTAIEAAPTKKVKDVKIVGIGKYDGALEEEDAGGVVEGESADDLALDSSMVECVPHFAVLVTIILIAHLEPARLRHGTCPTLR
jgi:hypothetical protein